MAVLTAKRISKAGIALLTRSLVLPMTVTRVAGEEFSGSNGDTVTVRVPQPGASREQVTPGATITYDDVTEIPVDVTLKHLYHGKLVTDEEMTYELEDFARQVSAVQIDAVATGAEATIAAVMNALTPRIEFAATATSADTKAVLLEAREILGEAEVPAANRYLAVSPSIGTRLLSVDDFTKVDASGSGSALREAVIGRLFGFTVVESPALDADEAVAYHSSGFVFANRTPVAPKGAADSASVTAQGIGLRQIFQYVPDKLSDASVVSTFAGAAAVNDVTPANDPTDYPRFVKIGVGS